MLYSSVYILPFTNADVIVYLYMTYVWYVISENDSTSWPNHVGVNFMSLYDLVGDKYTWTTAACFTWTFTLASVAQVTFEPYS